MVPQVAVALLSCWLLGGCAPQQLAVADFSRGAVQRDAQIWALQVHVANLTRALQQTNALA